MRKLCCVCLLLCFLFAQKAYSFHIAPTDIQSIERVSSFAPDTIIPPSIQLMENESRLICPDVPGFNTPLNITNLACEQLSFGGAAFNPGESCFTYTSGFNAGTDVICVEACDPVTFVCDTLIYTIIIDPTPLPSPTAGDDLVSVPQNDSIAIDVLANDTITGFPSITITINPVNGTASVNNDNTIQYVPIPGFCGVDSLTYVVCDQVDCVAANVSIAIICSEAPFTLYNGFSPNNDGINDELVIDNLDRIPDHKINIFNRWGNLVFSGTNYQSDWDGRWNGEDLPDGTYFYVVDDGNGNSYHGYIQLQR